jgi:hypothetical protein
MFFAFRLQVIYRILLKIKYMESELGLFKYGLVFINTGLNCLKIDLLEVPAHYKNLW